MAQEGLTLGDSVDPAAALAGARAAGAEGALVEDDLGDADPLAVAAALAAEGLAVVLVGGQPDLEAIRQAMMNGARDYVDEPFTPAELARAAAGAAAAVAGSAGGGGGRGAGAHSGPAPAKGEAARAADAGVRPATVPAQVTAPPRPAGPPGPEPSGRLVAVCGARGGSGRSVLTVNLAIALGIHAQQPAVAVDLCLGFGTLAALAGVEPERTLADACRPSGPVSPDVLAELTEAVPRLPLRVLAAPREPSRSAEIVGEANQRGGRNYISEVLGGLGKRFQWTVADLPPMPDDGWLAALDRATTVVVVAAPDVPGLAATARLIHLLNVLGVKAPKRLVVLNSPWGPARITPAVAGEAIGAPIDRVIPFDGAVGPAADTGHPLVGRRHRSPFTRAMADLAKHVAGASAEVPAPAAGGGGAEVGAGSA